MHYDIFSQFGKSLTFFDFCFVRLLKKLNFVFAFLSSFFEANEKIEEAKKNEEAKNG